MRRSFGSDVELNARVASGTAETDPALVKKIIDTLDPLSLEEKREVIEEVAKEHGITEADIERRRVKTLAQRRRKLQTQIEQKNGELAAADALFRDELADIYAPFMAFCKAIRGFEFGLEPGAHLMALGRIFIDAEKTSATELADLAQSLDEVTKIHPSCRKILGEVIPNWDTGLAYLHAVLDGEHSGFQMLFSRRWARAGYPIVEMGHKVAASLMFTHGSGDVTAPWPAFSLKIPDGLVTLDHANATAGATRVLCLAPSELNSFWQLRADFRMLTGPAAGSEKPFYFPARGLDDAIVATSEDGDTWPELNRALEMLCRLAAGACMLATAKQDIEEREWRPKSKPERRRTPGVEPPVGTRFIVAKNVELDMREQVHEYIVGKSRKGGKLTVQFVVRGHRRWQACGPRHSERKLIWINPFWKGPEEGRALLRGYEFKGREEEKETTP